MNDRKKREQGSLGDERDIQAGEDRKNKQPSTRRNPKGAGRPSREVSAARKVKEFTSNPERWLREHAPEWLEGRYGRSEGASKDDSPRGNKRIFKGLARGILGTIGFRQKEIDRLNIDAFDELTEMAINELKPSKSFAIWKIPAFAAGIVGWYKAEEKLVKEERIPRAVWDSWGEWKLNDYAHFVVGETEVIAYKFRLPQILHTGESVLKFLLDIIGSLVGFFTGIEEFFEDVANRHRQQYRDMQIERGNWVGLEETGFVTPTPSDIADPEEYDLEDLAQKVYDQKLFSLWKTLVPTWSDEQINWHVERNSIPDGWVYNEETKTFMTDEDYRKWLDLQEMVGDLPPIEGDPGLIRPTDVPDDIDRVI